MLGVGVYTGETGWEDGKRLTVRQVAPALPVLEGASLVRLGGFAQATDAATWTPIAPVTGAPSQVLDAAFAGGLHLTGATLPATAQPDAELPVTLFWQADTPPPADYSVFVQVLDATRANVAQWDGAPADAVSKLPASNWPAGWQGSHELPLALPTTLPPGEYTVIAGLYDWQTGERLPVNGGDSVEIGRVEIRD